MATNPRALTTVSTTAGASGGALDVICIISPVPDGADVIPRLFGAADAIFEQHGYSEGLEYAALHFQRTRKAVIFVGVPIDDPGVIGRENGAGNSGTCVVTLAEGPDGVLTEHDGIWKVKRGGTIGTDPIVLELSLDGGTTFQTVRLGTSNSYTDPYVGIVTSFGAGTLVAGDTIYEWHGTAPLMSSAVLADVREALAAQLKGFRSALLIGDAPDSTFVQAFVDQLEAYDTANDRYIYGRCSLPDRLPLAELSQVAARMTGAPTLTFAEVGATGDTVTRSGGSWIADGFAIGDHVTFVGTASNNVTGVIANLTALVLTLDDTDLEAEGPVSNVTATAVPGLVFAAAGDTITRNRGSWLADGFRPGDVVTVTGTASNNVTLAAVTVTATVLTLANGLADEEIGTADVSVSAGQTKAAWMAELEDDFAAVDGDYVVSMSAGRGRPNSPFTGWAFRRPVSWAASLREYQHDLHIPTWRKDDGNVGFAIHDASGALQEWDDRVDGGAGSAARFTTFRTWANGPGGAFIAQDLTRAGDGNILSHVHNTSVTNFARSIVQNITESFIGRSLILNEDGTATDDSLALLESEVNRELDRNLGTDLRGEGRRASRAVWQASRDDVFNVPEPTLTGVLELILNGTIHTVSTKVRVISGGAS